MNIAAATPTTAAKNSNAAVLSKNNATTKVKNVGETKGEASKNKGKVVKKDEPQEPEKEEEKEWKVKGKMIVQSEYKVGFGIYIWIAHLFPTKF